MEKLARENYGMHMNILGQIQERSASGVGRGVDLEQAYGRQSLAQSNMMTEAGNLNDVLQRYRRIVGVAAPEVMQAAPSLSESIPANTTDFLPSLRTSPVILAKQALYQAAESGKHVAQGRMSPTLEFRAATGKDKSDPPGSAYRDSQSSNIQLMLSYNLFRGGADTLLDERTAAGDLSGEAQTRLIRAGPGLVLRVAPCAASSPISPSPSTSAAGSAARASILVRRSGIRFDPTDANLPFTARA